MPVYNKLVRDRIPDVIIAAGKVPITRTLDETDFVQALKAKIIEEAQELFLANDAATSLGELADILEVISAYIGATQIDPAAIEAERNQKAAERGTFSQRIFLMEVRD